MACFRSRNVVQSWEPRRGFVEIDQCVADRVLKLVHQWFLAFMPDLSLIHLHMMILSSTIIKEVLSAWGGGCFATEVEHEARSQINGAQQRQCHGGNKGERKTAQLNHDISSPCKLLWIHFSLSLHPHCRRKVLASSPPEHLHMVLSAKMSIVLGNDHAHPATENTPRLATVQRLVLRNGSSAISKSKMAASLFGNALRFTLCNTLRLRHYLLHIHVQ